MNFKCKLRQLRYDIRYIAMNYPPLYILLTKFGDGYGTLTDFQTEIVIEGFPRSANTFAVNAFRLAQQRPIKIAHHKHSTTQFLIAKKNNIPTLLLIRKPEEAVISFVIREPCIPLYKALNYWISFHSKLVKYKEYFIIADFTEVTTDFDNVIKRINKHFNTQFEIFEHTPENVKKCFDKMESFQRKINNDQLNEFGIPRPSLDRKEKKKELINKLDEPKFRALRQEANKIYQDYLFFNL